MKKWQWVAWPIARRCGDGRGHNNNQVNQGLKVLTMRNHKKLTCNMYYYAILCRTASAIANIDLLRYAMLPTLCLKDMNQSLFC